MEKLKIFTTGGGAPGARGIFKSFRIGAREENRELEIVTSDMDKDAYGFHLADKHYIIPSGKSPEFISKLLEICEKEKPHLLYSWVTPELVPIAENRDKFEALGVKVVLSDAEALKIAQNKGKCYEAITEFGYAPKFKFVDSLEAIERAALELGYPEKPVCYKPAVAHGMRGFRIMKPGVNRADILFNEKPMSVFTTLEETKEILKDYRLPNMLVMEYLSGLEDKEYSLDILMNNGEPVVAIPRVRVKTRQGISYIAYVEQNQELIEAAEKIAKKLNLNYSINMQFKFSEDGKPKLIEINPRLSGTIIACVGAGANMPWLSAKIALGEEVKKPVVEWGTTMKRFWEEVYTNGNENWFLGI
ncbi:MAG: ATP-grasp domain-containing protein [Nanoarchaeota archaeon]|nr:ATP-grasp domain-containing protein [Nanoarchaeota archaeon]MBU1135187.1 ATP-grasp domain-containing protein [Nanoarchaeota archaeon]